MLKKTNISLLKQIQSFSVGSIVGVAVSLITAPLVTRMISPDEFGKVALFTLIYVLFSFIIFLGLDQTFARYYNSGIERKKLLFNILVVPICMCFIVILGIIVFRKQLSFWLFENYEPIIIIGLCVFLPGMLIKRFAMLYVRMNLRGKFYSFLTIISKLVIFICVLSLLLFFERSFRAIIFANIVSNVINTILVVIFTKNMWVLCPVDFDINLVKKFLHFGLPLVPTTMLFWVLNSFDKISLRNWSSYGELGLYAAAFKVVSLIGAVQIIFNTAWAPVAYKWYENGEDNKRFEQVSVAVLAATVTGSALIIVCRDVIMLFLGYEYRNASSIFMYLLFVPIMNAVSATTALGIVFSKKTKFNFFASVFTVVINIIFNYILIPIYGAWGAAISTCVSFLIFFWVTTLFSRKLWYKFGLIKYVVNFALLLLLIFVVELNMLRFMEIIVVMSIIIVNIYIANRYNILYRYLPLKSKRK